MKNKSLTLKKNVQVVLQASLTLIADSQTLMPSHVLSLLLEKTTGNQRAAKVNVDRYKTTPRKGRIPKISSHLFDFLLLSPL